MYSDFEIMQQARGKNTESSFNILSEWPGET